MTSIRFHLRPLRSEVRAKRVLFIRIIHNRRYRDIPRHYALYPEEWNESLQCPVWPSEVPTRKAYLDDVYASMQSDLVKLSRILDELQKRGRFSVGDIAENFYLTESDDTVLGYSRKLAAELAAAGRVRTARAYRSAGRSLAQFNGGRDVPLSSLRAEFIQRYEQYLFGRGLQMNTVSFYMRNLRAVYYRAVAAGKIHPQPVNPFNCVYTGVYETRRRSLDRDDIMALARLEMELSAQPTPNRREGTVPERGQPPLAEQLRDSLMYFMFAYHSRGMSFIDLAHLKKSEVNGGTIRYKRKKTGFFMEITVTSPMKKIIDHFSRSTAGSPYVFPILPPDECSNRNAYETALNYQNKRLKSVAAMAGVTKNLSTHVARHTWATMAKRLGYAVSLISEGLGHRDTKVTSIYLASFERSVMDELSAKLSSVLVA